MGKSKPASTDEEVDNREEHYDSLEGLAAASVSFYLSHR
jgi:hypothetical protein